VGVVEYPGTVADAKAHFGVIDAATTQNPAVFAKALQQQVALRPEGKRRAVVFVHGYNNTFAEALYMNTQIMHDYQSPDIPILFSWPSAGDNLGYLQDRDSVLYSRSALEALLDVIAGSDVDSLMIVGHSIGSQLVMEALRQHAIRNGGAQWPKLAGVVLVSPDIDVGMFEQQRKDMGALPQPFIVVGSSNDRLLALSGVINGNSVRLGTVEDAALLGNDDATVVSASFATEVFSANHTTAFASPAMIELLKELE
jgi:esterase/lipase superfamily enzyme